MIYERQCLLTSPCVNDFGPGIAMKTVWIREDMAVVGAKIADESKYSWTIDKVYSWRRWIKVGDVWKVTSWLSFQPEPKISKQ